MTAPEQLVTTEPAGDEPPVEAGEAPASRAVVMSQLRDAVGACQAVYEAALRQREALLVGDPQAIDTTSAELCERAEALQIAIDDSRTAADAYNTWVGVPPAMVGLDHSSTHDWQELRVEAQRTEARLAAALEQNERIAGDGLAYYDTCLHILAEGDDDYEEGRGTDTAGDRPRQPLFVDRAV